MNTADVDHLVLRLAVERIVRPVRGSVWRKNGMREELLGHLLEASDTLGAAGEVDAEAEAVRRLGDPAVVRASLQASVPWHEALGHLRLPFVGRFEWMLEGKPGDRPWRFAARLAWLALVGCVGIEVVICGLRQSVSAVMGLGALPWATLGPVVVVSTAALFVAMFLSGYGFARIGGPRLVARRSATPAWVKALLHVGLIAGMLFFFFALQELVPVTRGKMPWAKLFEGAGAGMAMLLFPVILTLGLWPALAHERRQYLKWGHLEVDE